MASELSLPYRMAQKTWVGCRVLQDLGVLDNGLAKHGLFHVSPSLKYVTNWNLENQSAKPSVPGRVEDLI